MELSNDFEIDRPIDETFRILNDLEFIAPCMPGAQLQEIEGAEYRGLVKIKVGPITANYNGKAEFVSQDPVAHVSTLRAQGRDARQGNANALITASMESITDERTKITIHTDLSLTGKIASFGRGAIEDVSKKILGQFADNLQAKIEAEGTPAGDAAAAADAASLAAASSAAASSAAAGAASPTTNGHGGVRLPRKQGHCRSSRRCCAHHSQDQLRCPRAGRHPRRER
ncbi:MAG: SRPBCC family protein [Acidimicrobiales bacterium]